MRFHLTSAGSYLFAPRDFRQGRLWIEKAKQVADGLRTFVSFLLWTTVAESLGREVGALKGHLDLIVDRRNKILHDLTTCQTAWVNAGL